MTSGNWTADGVWTESRYTKPQLIRSKSALSSCLAGKTLFFVGSSFTRVMLLGFLEELTGQKQNPSIGSRHPKRFCANLDGYDIETCGWPNSKWWIVERQGRKNKYAIVKEAQYTTSPPHAFPDGPGPNQWMIVFQFKTFVLTPQLDADIVRQAHGYKVNLLILEAGIWGYLPFLGSREEQTRLWLETIQQGYTSSNVIVITDGFHHGMIGPHVVNGSIARKLLADAVARAQFVSFDRTDLLVQASKLPALSESMDSHGYAGSVSNLHIQMLFSFMCNKV